MRISDGELIERPKKEQYFKYYLIELFSYHDLITTLIIVSLLTTHFEDGAA